MEGESKNELRTKLRNKDRAGISETQIKREGERD
jgi:hypothetical protein